MWFALTFWVYLDTHSVLATGILGGAYMLMVAVASLVFGSFVDKHYKKQVMALANLVCLICFAIGGVIYAAGLAGKQVDVDNPLLWLFGVVILFGAVIGNMRNIAMSTTVTLLVPADRRDKANGLVGATSGIGFVLTTSLSGLVIGQLGMGWVLVIVTTLMLLVTGHMWLIKIPEKEIAHDPSLANKKIDIKGGWLAISAVPGLLGLVVYSFLNNLTDGLLQVGINPYGLTLFSAEMWGVMFGLTGLGYAVGGFLVSKFGLGKNPLRLLMISLMIIGGIGVVFAIRESAILLVAGIFAYMMAVPFAEAAEQTVLQKVVPFAKQGRVFGLAAAIESVASPITTFIVAPIAEFWVVPTFRDPNVQASWSWLLGTGQARGLALMFFVGGLVLLVLALAAMRTKSYRLLSREYIS